jgi:AbrB family looped-hinge helix DNA binding protein
VLSKEQFSMLLTEVHMPATVTAKGQITIPKAVREALGVKPGSKVDFRRNDRGNIEIIKEGPKPKGRFDRFRGLATTKLTTDEIMAMTRGDE